MSRHSNDKESLESILFNETHESDKRVNHNYSGIGPLFLL